MAVLKGLKTLADNTPNFSNASTQALITAITSLSWVPVQKTMVDKSIASEVITNTNRTALQSALNNQAHLNINDYLSTLSTHTQAILAGTLGEADPTADPGEDVPTFLEHLAAVQGFVATIPSLYGVTADSLNKGLAGHFGSLAGTLDSTLTQLKSAMDLIISLNLSENTAYQTAMQNISDYIDTLADSTVFNSGTWSSLMSSLETAGDNFNTALTAGYLAAYRTALINSRSTINTQITLEQTNLGVIRTYADSLSNISNYVGFADDADFRNLLIRSSQNANWRSYFENYATNRALDNPVYDTTQADSSTESIVDTVLRMKGLPDVTDYVDLDSVAKKATRDTRLVGQLTYAGTITGTISVDIIKKACQLLNLTVANRDVYAQSKSLLENMNQYDRDTVQSELNLYNDVNTLS